MCSEVGTQRLKLLGIEVALKPGDQVTMDFSEARLNIDVDAAGVITGMRCG